jgi:chaperonin GroEL
MLQDIATLTGATVISEEMGMKLENTNLKQLGQAKSMKIGKEDTTIVEGVGSKREVHNRIAQIRMEIESTTSDYDREKLQERLAKLSGRVAVIHVGAATEVELKEKKHRVEDAISATRAAVEERVVPGGGLALLHVALELEKTLPSGFMESEKAGYRIVCKALEEPLRQIARNAGLDGAPVVERAKGEKKWIGFDAQRLVWDDLLKEGIIDPLKVTRSALQNAASVAGMVLTTECAVVDKPESNQAQFMPDLDEY